MNYSDRFQIVLVRPALAANVGAVARAMHNFGLTRLTLVQPECDPLDPLAVAVATHGCGILEAAKSVADLGDAVADCGLVVGTSARVVGILRSQQVVTPRQFMPQLLEAARSAPAALVFGPERTGLVNEEIVRCHWLLSIPAAEPNPVLNLAQAVAVCLYELHLACGEAVNIDAQPVADFASQERAYRHLEEALTALHFLWNSKATAQMHALRHLLGRAQPQPKEIDLLHGIARQMKWYVAHHPKRKEQD